MDLWNKNPEELLQVFPGKKSRTPEEIEELQGELLGHFRGELLEDY